MRHRHAGTGKSLKRCLYRSPDQNFPKHVPACSYHAKRRHGMDGTSPRTGCGRSSGKPCQNCFPPLK